MEITDLSDGSFDLPPAREVKFWTHSDKSACNVLFIVAYLTTQNQDGLQM